VNYQFLGTNDKSLLPKSIEFHEKHKEISDIHGKFIAHINLGLLYDVLGLNSAYLIKIIHRR
jgi:hypothetical protein